MLFVVMTHRFLNEEWPYNREVPYHPMPCSFIVSMAPVHQAIVSSILRAN